MTVPRGPIGADWGALQNEAPNVLALYLGEVQRDKDRGP